jgi:DNA primase
VIDGAIPMVHLLWRRETEGRNFDSPERKAALDTVLRQKIMLITDPSIRSHYGQAIKDLLWDLFRAQAKARTSGSFTRRVAKSGRGWKVPAEGAMPTTQSSFLVSAERVAEEHLCEAVVLATLLKNPKVLPEFEDALERLECRDPDHRRIQAALLRHIEAEADMLIESIEREIGSALLEKLFEHKHVAIAPPVRRPGNIELASMCVNEALVKLTARRGHEVEVREVSQDLGRNDGEPVDENLTWRLKEAAEGLQGGGDDADDTADFDVADNGAKLSRDERDTFAALLGSLDSIGNSKNSN